MFLPRESMRDLRSRPGVAHATRRRSARILPMTPSTGKLMPEILNWIFERVIGWKPSGLTFTFKKISLAGVGSLG